MGLPSSTSSSRPRQRRHTWPAAGLAAALLVLGLDRCALGSGPVWEGIAARVNATRAWTSEAGISRDRRLLAELRARPPARPRILLMGSSRGDAAFHPEWLPASERPPGSSAIFAHASLRPFELRSLVEALLPLQPDAAVLLASEFDTHYPLDLRPELAAGSLSALTDLLRAGGARFAWEHRLEASRLALAALLHGYRDRVILGIVGLRHLRRFRMVPRLKRPARAEDWMLAPGEREPVPPALKLRVQAEAKRFLPARSTFTVDVQMHQLRALSRGTHVAIQESLLRRAAERLLDAGSAVVIFEAPLFPGAAPLYDPAFRADFLAFARSLARTPGVRFVPLEDGPTYLPGEFSDLTHLARPGAEKLTRAALDAARAALAERDP